MRIGINVPNDLMKRLEPLKPELNISQVCRDALTAKAEKYEQMKASMNEDGISSAVKKIGDQEAEFRAAVEVDWERLAKEDAAAWVQAAGWDQWQNLREDLHFYKSPHIPQWEIIFPPDIDGVPDFYTRWDELSRRGDEMEKKHPGFRSWFLKNRQHFDVAHQAYMIAWLAFTDEVWELVQQRKLEHLEQQLAQRAAPPEPKVPEHLFGDVQSPKEQPFRVAPHHAGYAPGIDPLKLNHFS